MLRAFFAFSGDAEASGLLDLAFLELDMLAHDGVVLLHDELLGLGARVLLVT